MAEHGFLQPNPVLFDLESRKPKAVLGHELGLGSKCSKCGSDCAGFQLHFWRKVCQNCRCGKLEHGVQEGEDHGKHFVGRIFDRPIRTREEEYTFIYGELVEDILVDSKQKVCLDWAPPGVASSLASKYLRSLPDGHVSIQGSEGAVRRKRQLEKQFPLHDVEPDNCHQLSRGEIETMFSYVENVKRNVAGQGIVQELGQGAVDCLGKGYGEREHSHLATKKAHKKEQKRMTPSPPPPLPPPMQLLNVGTLSYTLAGTHLDKKLPNVNITYPTYMGTYHATPYSERDGLSLSPFKHNSQSDNNSKRSDCGSPNHMSPTPNQQTQFNCPDLYINRPHTPSHPPPSVPGNIHPITAYQQPAGKTWFCSGCSLNMLPGEIAIFAERAGPDKCWHPACFSCTQCGEMLEDLLYFYSNGQLFCGRDFASLMNIPRCGACDELIFSEEYTGAEDRFWHVKHFCCWICDMPLAGHKYIPVDGMPHCLACWQKHHGKCCSVCRGFIDPQGKRVSLGEHHWHASPECFKCGVCQTSLLGRKMSMRQGTLLCSSQCGQVHASMQEDMDADAGHSVLGQLLKGLHQQSQSGHPGQGNVVPSIKSYKSPKFQYETQTLPPKHLSASDFSPNIRKDSHSRQKSFETPHSRPIEQVKHERSASYSTIV